MTIARCVLAALLATGVTSYSLGQDGLFSCASEESTAGDITACVVRIPDRSDQGRWIQFSERTLTSCEQEYIDHGTRALNDPWNFRSSLAAIALGHVGHKECLKPLWASAQNRFRDTETRVWCIEAIAGIADERTVPRLIDLLDDPRVGVDCLRGLLLLVGNPLQLTDHDLLDLCRLFCNYDAVDLTEYSGGSIGFGKAEEPLFGVGKLAVQVGGFRAMLGRRHHKLHRGAEFYNLDPFGVSGYGADPIYVNIALRNVISEGVKRKYANLKSRYQEWWNKQKSSEVQTARAYRYTLTHPGALQGKYYVGKLRRVSALGDDSLVRVLKRKCPRIEVTEVPLPRLDALSSSTDQDTYLSYIADQFASITIPNRRTECLQGHKILDPLVSHQERALAAEDIRKSERGFNTLLTIAMNRFDSPIVRAACLDRLGSLYPSRSKRILLVTASDPNVSNVAIDNLAGAKAELKRARQAEPMLRFSVPTFLVRDDRFVSYAKSVVRSQKHLLYWANR